MRAQHRRERGEIRKESKNRERPRARALSLRLFSLSISRVLFSLSYSGPSRERKKRESKRNNRCLSNNLEPEELALGEREKKKREKKKQEETLTTESTKQRRRLDARDSISSPQRASMAPILLQPAVYPLEFYFIAREKKEGA